MFCRGRRHLSPHPGADCQLLGLPGVYLAGRQTRSGSPAGQSYLHAHRPLFRHHIRQQYPARRHRRQYHVGPAQRGHHIAALLERDPSQPPPRRARRLGSVGLADGAHLRRGYLRRPGLHVERHILVFGCRGRGIRLLVVLHGAGILAHTQVGKPRRRPSQRPLSHTHRIRDRRVHRRAPAQSALYPRHRAGILLSQVSQYQR